MNYADFVDGKLSRVPPTGLSEIPPLNATLFPHQVDLVTWALRRGRCAVFADTGLGKSVVQLEWARCVAQATGGRVLIIAPLAVGSQTVREAGRVGIEAKQVRYASDIADAPRIVITNYDRAHHFDPTVDIDGPGFEPFTGVVCDESSIIKNSDSKTFERLTRMFAATPFRLCATATPSPNDYTELGTHAEFLGICTKEEMLAEFFCHDGGETQTWRLKGHARGAFWRWVAGWAALIRKPSDFGYDDTGYALPPLIIKQHTIAVDHTTSRVNERGQSLLFAEPARTLTERRTARKETLNARVDALVQRVTEECEQCRLTKLEEHTIENTTGLTDTAFRSEHRRSKKSLATIQADSKWPRGICGCAKSEQWLIWVELNAEEDAIVDQLSTEAIAIRGSASPEEKEAAAQAWMRGDVRILISKPSIFGWGLNFQFAARMCFVGVKDSYESTYQAIRRCWRFGQKREVHVHVFASELEGEVVKNLQRKEADAFAMSEALSAETRDVVRAEIMGQKRQTNTYGAATIARVPSWLT